MLGLVKRRHGCCWDIDCLGMGLDAWNLVGMSVVLLHPRSMSLDGDFDGSCCKAVWKLRASCLAYLVTSHPSNPVAFQELGCEYAVSFCTVVVATHSPFNVEKTARRKIDGISSTQTTFFLPHSFSLHLSIIVRRGVLSHARALPSSVSHCGKKAGRMKVSNIQS
ncbi:hypothetical protein P280DRAFT_90503 [Massarina eburnea CBS 473.64]|uniref:Uncharacterized protein n=1 Tax=Massarina eburnea CBS 473.64 TaxID=1395130 RepID=A0A6A6RRW1_9PLEO|nr:hypothetical protein P280DRAFT_90503 [Massarina eburnea CBS 473.64]